MFTPMQSEGVISTYQVTDDVNINDDYIKEGKILYLLQ
jgi:hypothetical protein